MFWGKHVATDTLPLSHYDQNLLIIWAAKNWQSDDANSEQLFYAEMKMYVGLQYHSFKLPI